MEIQITNVQTLSVHDGPGVRTTIFLAGCPLRCIWCHNPETQSGKALLAFDAGKCVSCRTCTVCPNDAHVFDGTHHIFRERCLLCGSCISACPQKALSFSQRALTMEEFQRIVEKQQRIVGDRGGITFSGGEPLSQGKRFLSFLSATRAHRAVETCGYADEEIFLEMLEAADYIMFDLKLADEALHRRYTGKSNEPILRNLHHLKKSGKPFLLRTPLIPSVTDTEENLAAIEKIVGSAPWEKLSYNPLTPSKYERIGSPFLL